MNWFTNQSRVTQAAIIFFAGVALGVGMFVL